MDVFDCYQLADFLVKESLLRLEGLEFPAIWLFFFIFAG